jgi:hypothetical protein
MRLRSDFVQSICLYEGQFSQDVKEPYNLMKPAYKRLGVSVFEKATLNVFHNCLSSNRYSLVTLFAHRTYDGVEFHNGVFSSQKILDEIPSSFSGILDLSVCDPIELAILVKNHRPNCLARLIDRKVTPMWWFYFYLAFYKTISTDSLDYFTAFESTLKLSDQVFNGPI